MDGCCNREAPMREALKKIKYCAIIQSYLVQKCILSSEVNSSSHESVFKDMQRLSDYIKDLSDSVLSDNSINISDINSNSNISSNTSKSNSNSNSSSNSSNSNSNSNNSNSNSNDNINSNICSNIIRSSSGVNDINIEVLNEERNLNSVSEIKIRQPIPFCDLNARGPEISDHEVNFLAPSSSSSSSSAAAAVDPAAALTEYTSNLGYKNATNKENMAAATIYNNSSISSISCSSSKLNIDKINAVSNVCDSSLQNDCKAPQALPFDRLLHKIFSPKKLDGSQLNNSSTMDPYMAVKVVRQLDFNDSINLSPIKNPNHINHHQRINIISSSSNNSKNSNTSNFRSSSNNNRQAPPLNVDTNYIPAPGGGGVKKFPDVLPTNLFGNNNSVDLDDQDEDNDAISEASNISSVFSMLNSIDTEDWGKLVEKMDN